MWVIKYRIDIYKPLHTYLDVIDLVGNRNLIAIMKSAANPKIVNDLIM
jgi:hypothetical protein